MVSNLPRGGNMTLTSLLERRSGFSLRLDWSGDSPARPAVDPVAFLLGADGKVSNDSDMIFYNHVAASGDGVVLQPLLRSGEIFSQIFEVDLARLPASVERIAFCLAIHAEIGGVTSISQLHPLASCLLVDGREEIRAEVPSGNPAEAAVIMAEVYRRNGEWKFKSIGQGFSAGLARLAESYGVAVAEEAQAVALKDDSPSNVPVIPGRSAAPSVQFSPPHGGFGEITVQLSWGAPVPSGPSVEPVKSVGGVLGGLIGKNKAAVRTDLDLCALYELSDGYRGVVQALGGTLGAYNSAPFVELLGDNRGGAAVNPEGNTELLRINGARWDEIRRVLVFAMIFEGIPNWAQAQGRASIRIKDQLPVGVRLDQNSTDMRACTIALIENIDGKLAIHKRVETFKNPREIDQRYNWGLQWKAGTKD